MINERIIHDYYVCKYKAFLKYHKTTGVGHNYEMFEQRKIEEKESFIFSKIKNGNHILDLKDTNTEQFYFEKFYELIRNVTFSNNTFSIRVHLKSVKKSEEIGYLYSPIFFIPTYNIRHEHKLFVASCISVINNYSQHISQDCLLYNLSSNNPVNLQTNSYKNEANSGLIELSSIIDKSPVLYLNSHCPLCEYKFHCKKIAIEQDNLSLLKGLNVKEINKLNQKEIFTIHQYSFTFRPRKKRKRNTIFLVKHHHALQALAIRTNKTYIYSNTIIPASNNMIFIDIEYLPEEIHPYLIGLVIVNGKKKVQHSLWLKQIDEYKSMVEQFLKIVNKYKDFQIYHFGQSEHKFFESILALDIKYKSFVERILEKSVNILSIIYGNIYFPTYSNSLKDIAMYLGFKWTTENSTGLDAMYWRKQWLENNCNTFKELLIQYNIDDCLALKEVTNFIISAFQNDNNKYPDLLLQQVCLRIYLQGMESMNLALRNFLLKISNT